MAVITESKEPSAVGELLRTWRQRRNLSQLELSLNAEVSSRHLSFLETGRARPSRELVMRLAEELEPPANGMRIALHPQGMAPRTLNLTEWSAHLLHRVRREAQLTGDPELASLYEELVRYPGVEVAPPHREVQPGDIVLPLRLLD